MGDVKKGRVCVTGGTGFIGSWLIKRLLQDGYSVNATTRIDPDRKRDISFLTNLPGASERLHIFNADLDKPASFAAAIEGCIGVFHTAHPMDLQDQETEDVKTRRAVAGLHGILQACVDSGTVRRVVFTSSISAAFVSASGVWDENRLADVDFMRSLRMPGVSYALTKTLTEKAALDFAQAHGLDLVSVIPTIVTGPFICPHFPDSVALSMGPILGDERELERLKRAGSLVHVDDLARAHIHVFEYPEAKGRYICSGVDFTAPDLSHFISARYPEYKSKMATQESSEDLRDKMLPRLSSKKLEETGFKYQHGLEEIYDAAIQSCKEKGLL